MKKRFILSVLLAGIVTFGLVLASCSSDSNLLSGTWEFEPNNEYGAVISFSGKNFTITEFPIRHRFFSDWEETDQTTNRLSFIKDMKLNFDELELIETRTQEWDDLLQRGIITSTEEWNYFRNIMNGTYSIKDDKIELLFSDSSVEVYSFSRTENTITIDREQFILKM